MRATFVAPTSVADVLAALSAGARVVAGGTDLVVGARQGKAPLPEQLVAIHRVDTLRALSHKNGLRLGSLVTHEKIIADDVVRTQYSALADASAIVGSHATRATGTIGGNVMNASPAMDCGGPLLCLGASAVLESTTGSRTVTLDELWLSPGRTSARADELLVAIDVPAPSKGAGSCYVRLEYRRQMEIAVVGATAVVVVGGDGLIQSARIAMTALSPTIHRVESAEDALVGTTGDRVSADSAAVLFAAATTPISDVRASADYRRAMAAVICRRAIQAAVARATGHDVPIPASTSLHGAH